VTNAEARDRAKVRLLAERGQLTRRLAQVDRMLDALDDTADLADGVDAMNAKPEDPPK
jgi:hypothetical protein